MNAKWLKSAAKIGTVLAGTAASFILAACINVKEDDDEDAGVIEGDCEVMDSEESGESAETEEAGS